MRGCAVWVAVCGVLLSGAAMGQEAKPVPAYEQVMTKAAESYLAKREAAIAKITTREQAEAWRDQTKALLLKLLGGLPENAGPLNAQVVGSTQKDGYRIERIIYDSLPGYHVTANLYLPTTGSGKYPAVIYHEGHGPGGKAGAFQLGGNLARNGIALLAYDPLGAGERLQARNPETGKSWAGPDEHSQAEIPIELVGDSVARYMVWDAMRGIDYLATRPDIDAANIGSYGCSGGGTLSAYLTALDTRVKAGAVACYLTTYDALLKSIGPQDGEQVIPDFIKDGLDFADLVEMTAPRAYAQISTTEDMFPFVGAKATNEEAERIYSLYGAGDSLKFFTGPGRHGQVQPEMPQLVQFFEHWLAGKDGPAPEIVKIDRPAPEEIQCTSTGQVTTALPGRTIYEINRERAKALMPKKVDVISKADLAKLTERLKTEIPAVTGMRPSEPVAAPTVVKTEQRDGYKLETLVFHSRWGMDLPAALAIPDKPGHKPAVLATSDRAIETVAAAGSAVDAAAKEGRVVLAMTPLPWPQSTDPARPTMGTMLPWTSRAFLVGQTFVGMRSEDMVAATDWLAAQKDVDAKAIEAWADGPSGVALLHAAVMEPRIHSVKLARTLVSYQSVLEANPHRGVTETVVPGVLLQYDLDDLLIALAPRTVTVVNPVDAEGTAVSPERFAAMMRRVEAADKALKMGGRVRVLEAGR
ncbi:MAG TPA: acetylxylan esterase [Granulicella sp.]